MRTEIEEISRYGRIEDENGTIKNYLALLATISGRKYKPGEKIKKGYTVQEGRVFPTRNTAMKIFRLSEKGRC